MDIELPNNKLSNSVKPDPNLATFLMEALLPRACISIVDIANKLPTLTSPITLAVDDRRQKLPSLRLNEDPKVTKSRTLMEEPSRTKLRTLMPEPTVMKSRIEQQLPMRPMPYNELEDPKRVH